MSKQEEIKQALAAATPGPWSVYQSRVGANQTETLIGTEYDHPQLKSPISIVGHAFSVGIEYTYIREEDAELIAKAPEYIAYLLKELEEAQRSKDVMSNYLNELMHNTSNMVVASQIYNVLREAVGRDDFNPVIQKGDNTYE
ncbi:hypothetical protein IFU39_00350 [Paenibacillus sp. CFBP 13594]|uniref:hypothetical protein n=1 Tax=Paenibacillus sp. CFBP 13594 TaxID=2774037 RepID=UPI00177DBD17|nr:hypothetical protein [Paenibacillus sp. CFBP 13594]MBD8836269.1 hypothetical protein [Paenibacillus sp. CFBP 13594]